MSQTLTTYERTKIQRIKNINAKKFYCSDCDKVFKDSFDLKNHLAKTKKHNPEKYIIYKCECCNFKSRFKPVYKKHLESRKHIRLSTPPPDIIQPEN